MLREETLTSRSIVGIGNVGVTIGKVGAVIRTEVDEDYVQGPFLQCSEGSWSDTEGRSKRDLEKRSILLLVSSTLA